ncbi:hypothetical protein P2318_20215 [Myxococcaceae bacterium GXIMD 01537]
MRIAGAVLLAVCLGGCTSVKMVQRDGCWVKQTEKWPKRLTEEVGPCSRPAPEWSQDRLTRLVQECVAQSDYRWRNQAIAAWSRGETLPQREPEDNVLQSCMSEASRTVVLENESLKTRLSEVSSDRETLREDVAIDRNHLRASHDRVTDALGEAAKKPPGAAVATATSTSDGTATTQSDQRSQTSHASELGALPGAPRTVPAPKPMRARDTKTPSAASNPKACEPAPTPAVPVQPATASTQPENPPKPPAP